MENKIGNFILDLFFPKFCLNCQREGTFLCEDCKAILDISNSHHPPPNFGGGQTINLNDLYWAVEYKNSLIKNLIKLFKYEPFVKELAKDLASLIINHFQLIKEDKSSFLPFAAARVLDEKPVFLKKNLDYVLVPVPLEKRKLKWRGFNQAEEVGKEIAKFLKIPLFNDVLIKNRETLAQVELSEEERKENIKEAFSCQNPKKIYPVRELKKFGYSKNIDFSNGVKEKKILLVDDVYTTGSTMKECAKVLKKAGAKEVIGIVIARAAPGQDQFKSVQ